MRWQLDTLGCSNHKLLCLNAKSRIPRKATRCESPSTQQRFAKRDDKESSFLLQASVYNCTTIGEKQIRRNVYGVDVALTQHKNENKIESEEQIATQHHKKE